MKKAGISLSDTDWEKFYTPFAAYAEMPMIEDPADPDSEIPKYTEEEHVTHVIKVFLKKARARGRNKLKLEQSSVYDNDILGE